MMRSVFGRTTYCSYIIGISTSPPPNTMLPKRYTFSKRLYTFLLSQSCFRAVSERNALPINTKANKIKFPQRKDLRFEVSTSAVSFFQNNILTAPATISTLGNILGFIGYSGILNAGKFGVTGFNVSGAASVISEDDNTFFSPSITAFYTKPFYLNKRKRLTISPELYIISTPLIYSTKDKVTQSDRTFSFFAGSGFDYQISKKFKFNVNYKLNASTNREFPILSFFLVGSKINL